MNMEFSGRGKPSPDKSKLLAANEPAERGPSAVEIGLNAAIVAVVDNEPVVLIVRAEPDSAGATDVLPFGPFTPRQHRTLEAGLRAWVREQTGLDLGYAEQLYTFGDRGRHADQKTPRHPSCRSAIWP